MKKNILIILFLLIFPSLLLYAQEENLSIQEENLVLETDFLSNNWITTQEQRDNRYHQKQEIKNQILNLYDQIKKSKEKEIKKEIKMIIAQLKKELWIVNTRIAHSYEKSFKKFLWLK